jgi:hypothetical protein
VLGAAALMTGLALHVLAVALRDAGPEWGAISLRGNGATVVLPLAVVALVVTEVFCVRHRAWFGLALVPVALVAGLFVVLGGI